MSVVLKRRNSFHLSLSWSFLAFGVFVNAVHNILPHTQRLEAPELTERTLAASILLLEYHNRSRALSPANCLVKGRGFLFQENIIHKMLLTCSFSFPFTFNWPIQKKYLRITIHFLSYIYNQYYFGLFYHSVPLKIKMELLNWNNYLFIKPQWNSSGMLLLTCK